MLFPQRSQASKAKRMGSSQAVMHVKVAHKGNQFSRQLWREGDGDDSNKTLKTQQQQSRRRTELMQLDAHLLFC